VFSFGGQELFIIVLLALLLFGPDKIPQVARTIGRFMREFNKYKSIMEQTLSSEIYKAEGATKDPMTIEERIAKAGAASDSITEAREAEAARTASGPGEDAGADEPAVPTEGADAGDDGDRPATRNRQHPTTAPLADETDEEDEE
jgi:TatA/E family protein of Tat protein translocase